MGIRKNDKNLVIGVSLKIWHRRNDLLQKVEPAFRLDAKFSEKMKKKF
jgi:hypothetical protein